MRAAPRDAARPAAVPVLPQNPLITNEPTRTVSAPYAATDLRLSRARQAARRRTLYARTD
jgi:hypothetical protein